MVLFKGKRVDNGEEVQGFYLISNGIHYIIDCSGVTSTAIALANDIGAFPGYHEVHPESVQQIGFAEDGVVSRLVGALEKYLNWVDDKTKWQGANCQQELQRTIKLMRKTLAEWKATGE